MKKLKLGIFGMKRGGDNFESILSNNVEIVAVCDKNLDFCKRATGVFENCVAYDNFDDFIEHKMDAVYIANYFTEHAKYAIRALEKNIHVISECTAAETMADCVALIRAAEKSKALYMLGENYPYMPFNMEMQRVYQGGSLGKILFGEGEYNHPSGPDEKWAVSFYHDSEKHWRYYLPATYYLTHSLGPLMMATHSLPKRVTAMPVFSPEDDRYATASHVGDTAAIITCLNDDDSVFRITGCAGFGAHENSYRLACEKGQIENVRGLEGKIMLRYNNWDKPKNKKADNFYYPKEKKKDAEISKRAGHAGGDYYMFKDFFSCIRTGRRPYLDVYVATTMTVVGIMAHKSLLQFGVPYDIPDLRDEKVRKQYENDTDTPFWSSDGKAPTIPCCSRPDFLPSEKNLELYEMYKDPDWEEHI